MFTIRTMTWCVLVHVLIVSSGALAWPSRSAPARHFCWKLASSTRTIYLLGSVHVGTKDIYPLPAPIERAFQAAGALAVEVDETALSPLAMMGTLFDRGMYLPNDSLSEHLTPETRKALTRYLADHPGSILSERLRPWVATVIVAVEELVSAGFDPALGIDKHFLTAAHSANKPVHELETAAGQIELMSSSPESEQDLHLRKVLENAGKLSEQVTHFLALWRRGDTVAFEKAMTAEMSDAMGERMLYTRNRQMAGRIEKLVQASPRPLFVVVGAAHLVGERGLINLLAQRSYRAEQLQTP